MGGFSNEEEQYKALSFALRAMGILSSERVLDSIGWETPSAARRPGHTSPLHGLVHRSRGFGLFLKENGTLRRTQY